MPAGASLAQWVVRSRSLLTCLALVVAILGCTETRTTAGDDRSPAADAGPVDTGAVDAGAVDVGAADVGAADDGAADVGTNDLLGEDAADVDVADAVTPGDVAPDLPPDVPSELPADDVLAWPDASDVLVDAPSGAESVTLPPPQTIAAFDALLDANDAPALMTWLGTYDMPICDASTCLFVTRDDDATSLVVTGDFDAWESTVTMTETPLVSGVWWAKVAVSTAQTTVIEYKLRRDGNWDLDRTGRYVRFAPLGPNSAIYPPGASRIAHLPDVASTELANSRSLYVYLPAIYFTDPALHLPVLYMQDGLNVFTNPNAPYGSWDVETTADALIPAGLAAPVIIVGIDTKARLDEYTYAAIKLGLSKSTPKLPKYAAFLVGTVKPLIDATFRTQVGPESTAIAGSSLGGISSMWIAWKYSSVFGKVASFSGSYWIGDEETGPGLEPMRALITQNADGLKPSALRIYLDSGDTDFSGKSAYAADAWVYTDWTRNALIAQGWDNRSEWDTDAALASPPMDLPPTTAIGSVPHLTWSAEPPGGIWANWLGLQRNLCALVGPGHQHNEAAWKARFAAAYVYLFPGPKALP